MTAAALPVKRCDLAIIGMGLAGLAAGLFARRRRIAAVQIGPASEIIFASGLMDLYGVHPVERRTRWHRPWEALAAVRRDTPEHPLARLGDEQIRAALEEFFDGLEGLGLTYRRHADRNVQVPTSVGSVKLTYGVPESMWAAVTAMETAAPSLIVAFEGLKGFSARQIAANLRDRWPALHCVTLPFPGAGTQGELYTEHMARALEQHEVRQRLADMIHPHLKGVAAVGLPPVLGIERCRRVHADLQQMLDQPVFEIPGLPPSVPGLRLMEALTRTDGDACLEVVPARRVLHAGRTADGEFDLQVGKTAADTRVTARGVILAAGRFMGRGLRADRGGVHETLFGLPVHGVPASRADWHRHTFLDPAGHPINRCGLITDDSLRPLGRNGRIAAPNLFAAGSILAHQDWMRMKCGAALAVASAYAAVEGFLAEGLTTG